jgi:hypothetical protein
MSLNQNFAGATLLSGRRKLDGSERGLDTLIGLVVFIAELLIGFLAVYALYLYGVDAAATAPGSARGSIDAGFAIALVGSSVAFGVTTIIFLVRLARARRSWPAPLWGLILLAVASVIGYLVMIS